MNLTRVLRSRALGLVPVFTVALVLSPRPTISAAQQPESIVAVDSVVVVVSAESPVVELPRLHLIDIYLGRTARFPDGRRAVPINQAAGSREQLAFYDHYLGRTAAEMKAHWSKLVFTGRGRPPPDVSGSEAVRERIAADPSAVGYIDANLVDASVRVVRIH